MPIRLENDALHTAAGTLPRAIEVNAIDDCTVDGSVHRNSRPSASCVPTMADASGIRPTPSRGNMANVHRNTSRCRRQCVTPAMIASRDSLAPCMKNNRAMARLVISANTVDASPRHGSTLARITVPIRAIVNLSKSRARCCFHGDLKDGDWHVHRRIMRHTLLDFPGRHA